MKIWFAERFAFCTDFFDKLSKSKDSGFEKFVSGLLFVPSVMMPGVLIKNFVAGRDKHVRAGFVNGYVIFKVLLAFCALKYGWYIDAQGHKAVMFWALAVLTFETVHYSLLQIVCHDCFDGVNSYKRSILFAFFNYLEVTFSFACFYAALGAVRDSTHLDVPGKFAWIDYVYFSMGSGGIISYGNYGVYSAAGKELVVLHCLIFLMFFSLFITYNVTLLTNKTQ